MSTPDSLSDNPLREAFEARWAVISLDGGTLEAPVDATRPMKAEDFDHRIVMASLPGLTASKEADERPDLVIIRTIGQGGMGRVELARQHSLNREVAIKQLIPERRTPESLAALLREARITGSLEHPNIVPVHALGLETQGMPMIVMKRIEGVCWRDLIQDPSHPVWETLPESRLEWHLKVLVEVCDALHFAHSKGVVHRDIKPENVMIGDFGEVYLLDWGIALDLGQGEAAEEDELVGTPAYMPPEMTGVNKTPVTVRSDVYLLGATLHEVLTGEPRHHRETLYQTLLCAFESARFEDYDEAVPTELAEICNRACAADPEARFETIQALKEAVLDFLEHRDSVRLSNAAEGQLSALEALLTESTHDNEALLRIQEHFSASRFGFRQALEIWPENGQAAEGLKRALEAMLGHEIEARELGAAERLLAMLDEPPEALVAGVVRLREALSKEHEAAERLRDMEFHQDHRVSVRQRSIATLYMGLVWTGALGALSALERLEIYKVTTAVYMVAMGVIGVAIGAVVLMARGSLLRNKINRRLIGTVGVLVASCLLVGVVGILLGWAPKQIIVVDVLSLAAIMGISALSVHWTNLLFAFIAAVAAIFAALLPSWTYEIIGAAVLMVHTIIGVVGLSNASIPAGKRP